MNWKKYWKQKKTKNFLNIYMDVLHEIELLDGFDITVKVEEVLHGLGFTDDQLDKPYKQFRADGE